MIFVRNPWARQKSASGLSYATDEDVAGAVEIDGTKTDQLRVFAAREFHMAYADVTKRHRQIYKTLRHSRHYGMGAEAFAEVLRRNGI